MVFRIIAIAFPAVAIAFPALAMAFPAVAMVFPALAIVFPALAMAFPIAALAFPALAMVFPASAIVFLAVAIVFPVAAIVFPALALPSISAELVRHCLAIGPMNPTTSQADAAIRSSPTTIVPSLQILHLTFTEHLLTFRRKALIITTWRICDVYFYRSSILPHN
jgi:hypothetical protein